MQPKPDATTSGRRPTRRDLALVFDGALVDASGQVDEAGTLVANAAFAGKIPADLVGAYVRMVRADLPNGRLVMQGIMRPR
jgi:hypothetical protein